MRPLLALLSLPAFLAGGVTACGDTAAEVSTSSESIDFLPGSRVGELAEQQLEAEHLEMAVGSMACPDLDWKLDAAVRCVKTSELSDGRRVKIGGTVTVTSTSGGGRLHVELDEVAAEFGVDGGHLADAVSAWAREQGQALSAVDCPYLTGAVENRVRCAVSGAAGRRWVGWVIVEVTAVDAAEYRTEYTLRWPAGARRPEASPTFVATDPAAVVD